MKNAETSPARATQPPPSAAGAMPDTASLAALRAWYEGISAREAVRRYLGHTKADGQSSRGMLGVIRRQLACAAIRRRRKDLALLFLASDAERGHRAAAVSAAIEVL